MVKCLIVGLALQRELRGLYIHQGLKNYCTFCQMLKFLIVGPALQRELRDLYCISAKD
jgi:hypothetical protein